MKVGDLIWWKAPQTPQSSTDRAAMMSKQMLGYGIVLSKQSCAGPDGYPQQWVTAYYPKVGEIYDTEESLLEVIGGGK